MASETNHIEITIHKEGHLHDCKMTLNPSIYETMIEGLELLFEVELLQGAIYQEGTKKIIEFQASEEKLKLLQQAFVYQIYLAKRNLN